LYGAPRYGEVDPFSIASSRFAAHSKGIRLPQRSRRRPEVACKLDKSMAWLSGVPNKIGWPRRGSGRMEDEDSHSLPTGRAEPIWHPLPWTSAL